MQCSSEVLFNGRPLLEREERMSYLNGLWLLVLGLLAVPSLVIAKKPEAKEWFDKVVPFQGWFGVASAVYGLIQVIRFLGQLRWFDLAPIGFLSWLVSGILLLVLGLLLGVGVMKTFISAENAKAKMDETIAKLAPKQGTFGIAGIIVGLWIVVYRLIGGAF
jgi:hypothetical protein